MIKFSRRLFLSGLTTLAVISAMQITTSCSEKVKISNNLSNKSLGEVNLYSSRHYNTDTELYEGFTKETGIQVNLVEGSADELIERIRSEGENTKADVFMTVDVGRLWRAQKTNIFMPISSPILEERIPAPLREKNGYWFGFTKRSRVIVYNKSKVKPEELSTYESLADTKWKDRIIIRPSSNIYNQSLVASLIEANGEESTEKWVRGFVANFARPPQSNDTGQIRDVAAGVGDITLANTYYMARFAKSDDPIDKEVIKKIGVFFPNQEGRGAHINISGAGVVRNSPNQANAIKFLEYLTSSKAQEFFARGNDEYPVVEGAILDPVLKSFGTFKADDTNIASFGENLSTAVKVMNRAGWK